MEDFLTDHERQVIRELADDFDRVGAGGWVNYEFLENLLLTYKTADALEKMSANESQVVKWSRQMAKAAKARRVKRWKGK